MTVRKLIKLDPGDTARALTRVPLFAGCSEYEVREIAELAHLLRFEDGAVIVPEGEEGLGFYFVTSGRARVLRDGIPIATLGSGDFFGEVSLIEGSARNASVTAEGETICIGILRSFFRPLLARNPRLALRILEEEQRRIELEALDFDGESAP